jgi:arginase family enzyme
LFSACARNALANLLKPTATTAALTAMATAAAFSNEKTIHLEAHFDFIDVRDNTTRDCGSPMRQTSEMRQVKGITTRGPQNIAALSC